MKTLKIIGIIFLLSLFGCAPEGGSGGGSDEEPQVLVNPSGKAEAGMCKLGSIVAGADVNLSYLVNAYVEGEVTQNDGTFNIPNTFSGPFLLEKFEGSCYSEGDNLYVDNVKMRSICPISASPCNINHATSWVTSLGYQYFNDESHPNYQSISGSYLAARDDIYTFLNFPNASANFYSMSIVGDTTADAYLLAFETAVSKGRSGPEQGDYIGRAVNAVINNDISFRTDLRNTIANMQIKQVVENLNSELASLGFSETAAPIWTLPWFPDYYQDLMVRTPVSVESKNMDISPSCGFDTNDFNLFAHPVNFTSIDQAQYIAFKYINGEIEIWNLTTCDQGAGVFFCPNTKVTNVEELREILLPGTASYNGKITNNTLINGSGYFITQKKDSNFAPTFTCLQGEMVPFGNPLASNDGGVTWTILTGASYQRALAYKLFD